MLELLTSPAAWVSIAALTLMEVVLGVDNIIFISILSVRLPRREQGRARLIGLALACIIRIALIFLIGWIIQLQQPLFQWAGIGFSGRDCILLAGGVFLIYKATMEIHEKLEGSEDADAGKNATADFMRTVIQISLLNLVFSIDSIITAIGMTHDIIVMIIAVVLSLGFMLWVGRPVGDFVMKHPSVKMLALGFLLLIGVSLISDGLHKELPKAYLYSAMAFAVFVESMNLLARRRSHSKSVNLRQNVVGVNIAHEQKPSKATDAR